MKKSAREKLLEVIEKDIFKSEQRIKDEETHLDNLKEERNDILRELCDEEVSFQNPHGPHTIFFQGDIS